MRFSVVLKESVFNGISPIHLPRGVNAIRFRVVWGPYLPTSVSGLHESVF